MLGEALDEFDFETSFIRRTEFPDSDGGTVIFKRLSLVKRLVNMFITKKLGTIEYANFYFRHSAGTGKTVLLKLLGKELQNRGFIVFMLTAPEMEKKLVGFQSLVNKLGKEGKQVALLTDEVQRNVDSQHWDYLLKKAPTNLLVIGTGISELYFDSPQFKYKFPRVSNPTVIGPLTEEDMPEVLAHFIPEGDAQCEIKRTALRGLLLATGGQVFPFVTFAKHLLMPERAEHLSNLSAYLTSEKFYNCVDYSEVRSRCYEPSRDELDMLARFLLEKPLMPNDSINAKRGGLWTDTGFVSPLLVQELFRSQLFSPSEKFLLDFSAKTSPVVEQVIASGFAGMKAIDFEESNFSTMENNERGLAFRWGVCCGSALKDQVWVSSEVVTDARVGQSGAKPTIDFVVNGRLNLGLELAKDRSKNAMLDKLKKIGDGGVYGRHDSYLLHFFFKGTMDDAISQVEQFPRKKQSRVYTFLKDYNALLCGTKIVRRNIVKGLAAPVSMHPTNVKHFSSMTLGTLRRLGRIV